MLEARTSRFPITLLFMFQSDFIYQNIQVSKGIAALQFFSENNAVMYAVECIKENVLRTCVFQSNKYIISFAPKDDWLVLNSDFGESLLTT